MIIKLKRGLEADIPALQEGEPGFTTDSKKLFVGSDAGNIEVGGSGLLLKENKSEKGIANGYASLDSGAKIPSSQLPDSILGQLEYKGSHNCSTGAYPLNPEKGWYYICSTGGTISGISYIVGDWLVYNGSSWDKIDNTDAVASVNGKLGAVVLKGTDIKVSNADDVAIDTRILAMISDINDRYTKAQTYSRDEVDSLTTKLVEVTWQELKNKRDAGELVPGAHYRITNYTCTTVQNNTQSAGHQFDIIVTADSVNKLNENARACLHAGDVYFTYSKLESWKISYCLDNDTARFAWADSVNGKGVIYQMIDEWNNDCPYDFKNIQFKKSSVWLYTFKDDLVGDSYNNKIGVYISINKMTLNSNTFAHRCHDNTFGNSCFSNTFGNDCISNTFRYNCYYNTFGDMCFNNAFGSNCINNTFGNYCSSNTFGNSCNYLQISDISITPKRFIHVEDGTRGASNVNMFDLYDSAILDKNYLVTFKKDADGRYVMTWLDDYDKLEGKYKDNNLDITWKALPHDIDGGVW